MDLILYGGRREVEACSRRLSATERALVDVEQHAPDDDEGILPWLSMAVVMVRSKGFRRNERSRTTISGSTLETAFGPE